MPRYRNNQLAHAWYYGLADSGDGSNFYFRGDTIYSYGSHFPIARKVNGSRCIVLLTCKGYSVTTAQHIGYTSSAIDHSYSRVFKVLNVRAEGTVEHRANLTGYIKQIEHVADKYHKARSRKPQWAYELETLCDEYTAYAKTFLPDDSRVESIDVEHFLGEGYRDKLREEAAKRKQREEEEKAKRVLAAQENIDRWKAGEVHHIPYSYSLPVYLRVRNRGTEDAVVETSHGAEFPAKHAHAAWRVIQICRAKGREWKTNGHSIRLGHYSVDAVHKNGDLKAGCHYVVYEESLRIAEQLGLLNQAEEEAVL